ncbi:MAG: M48 family metalloprotease [Acidobacteria bacterium]|nr:M48 family metalloprotease [Acidobacteriota bacterium]
MTYYLIGICALLAAFFAANAAGSLAAACAWRAARALAARRLSSAARADLAFALRTAPTALAAAFTAALLAPAYFANEPAHTGEAVSAKLAALALLSAAGFAAAAWRCAASLVATRRVSSSLMRRATPFAAGGAGVAVMRVEHRLPLVAVVGVFRPKVFVATSVFDALGEDELRAAVAHELGHVSSRDNLKRTLMRACRDALPAAPFARALERAWDEESEGAADEFAARAGGAQAAVALASALVKIARLMPAEGFDKRAAIALLVDGGAGVAGRVDRLLNIADEPATGARSSRPNLRRHAAAACTLVAFAAVALLAAQPHVTRALYSALEHVVSALS